MRREIVRGARAALVMAVGSTIGCGDGDPGLVRPPASACVARQTTVSGPRTDIYPRQLRLHDGRLYYMAGNHFEALPLAGGSPVVLGTVPDPLVDFWIAGDQLLYFDYTERLWTMPMAGGARAAVGSALTPDGLQPFTAAAAFDGASVYGISADLRGIERGWSFWRRGLDGSPPQALGEPKPDGSVYYQQLALVGNDLVIAGYNGQAFAVDRTGAGPVRLLAPGVSSGFIGLDDQGALWCEERRVGENLLCDVVRTPASGGPRQPLWSMTGVTFSPLQAWQGDASTWVFTGVEAFVDKPFASSIWTFDASSGGRRLDCDGRGAGGNGAYLTVEPVLTPEALYSVTTDSETHTWSIVRIPR
jgi:hypothetical protein